MPKFTGLRILRKCSRLAVAVMALGCAAPSALLAVEEGDEPEAKEDWKEQIAALTTQIEALRDKQGDSLKDGAGHMEATILASEAMNAAARQIAWDLKAKNADAVTILSGGAIPDLDSYLALSIEIDGLGKLLWAQRPVDRRDGDGPVSTRGLLPIAGIGEAIGLLSSLLRSETEISDLPDIQLDAGALGLAVASELTSKEIPVTLSNRVIFTNWRTDPNISALINELDGLQELADAIRAAGTPNEGQQAALKRYDDFIVRIQTPVEGKVPLLTALRAAKLASTVSTSSLLELRVEKVGGTLLKRKNLAVALGASALGITGGAVVSYSLTDKDGLVTAAGLLHCGTTLTNFKTVHKREYIGGRCNAIPQVEGEIKFDPAKKKPRLDGSAGTQG